MSYHSYRYRWIVFYHPYQDKWIMSLQNSIFYHPFIPPPPLIICCDENFLSMSWQNPLNYFQSSQIIQLWEISSTGEQSSHVSQFEESKILGLNNFRRELQSMKITTLDRPLAECQSYKPPRTCGPVSKPCLSIYICCIYICICIYAVPINTDAVPAWRRPSNMRWVFSQFLSHFTFNLSCADNV